MAEKCFVRSDFTQLGLRDSPVVRAFDAVGQLVCGKRESRGTDPVRFNQGRRRSSGSRVRPVPVYGDLCDRGSRVKEGFTAATDRTSCLSFGAPVYVYVEAAQPELGMLIVGDVGLAALHRGDLGAFRFQRTIAN